MTFKNNSLDFAIAYLDGFQFHGFRLGLERITAILSALGNPHLSYPCVHVTGTNGKGSVCATIASILSKAGLKTGLYTSPHLLSVRERFRINGKEIGEEALCRFILRIKDLVDNGYELSYFEYTTAIAMEWFRQEGADIAVFETGLGGRLDATNVVTPVVSIITNVSFDHMSYLGATLAEIAHEKAGIIKTGVPVISGVMDESPREVIRARCNEMNASLLELGRDFDVKERANGLWDYNGRNMNVCDIRLRLSGAHQALNLAMALAACEILIEYGFKIETSAIKKGVKEVFWPCRAEFLRGPCLALIDGAHNPAGVHALKSLLEDFVSKEGVAHSPKVLLWACSNEGKDKDFVSMLNEMVPFFDRVIVTEPPGPRHPVTVDEWLTSGEPADAVLLERSWEAALRAALSAAIGKANGQHGFLCVAGSLYLAGAARERLIKSGFSPPPI
ncbi:MAG: bifunctional folylpolyglutamate synthase/dihydrofolate synthase [Dissulfurimicrobium sp.]|uniref:bifunctional folylpolyglutamate synthase/dihydrofolate synthase n=1 Tax=Dissulfurimicrobium sp. TaxID=2022436 RepID=UPI00404AAFAE